VVFGKNLLDPKPFNYCGMAKYLRIFMFARMKTFSLLKATIAVA